MTDLVTTAVERARRDLAARLKVSENDISEESVERAEFPDAALGAHVDDEMSAQMISNGHRIKLKHNNRVYEYRASGTTLRLVDFNGENYRVK